MRVGVGRKKETELVRIGMLRSIVERTKRVQLNVPCNYYAGLKAMCERTEQCIEPSVGK
jgi:hypothetical protein